MTSKEEFDERYGKLYGEHIPVDPRVAAQGLAAQAPPPGPTVRPFVSIENVKGPAVVVGVKGEF